MRGAGVVAAGVLLVCAELSAQTNPHAPVAQLDTLVAHATRVFTTHGGASAIAVRLDSLRLPPSPSVERVMRELPFVQVRTNPRGEAYFALRGSGFDAREVAVLVDGLPLSLGFDHRADLSVLPASAARTLTFVRGVPSLLYGPNVLGGVVELGVAALPDSRSNAHARAGYDTNGFGADASGSLESGRLYVRAGAGYRDSDGFPLPDGVHEPAPFSDDDVRLNSDRTQRDGFVTARYAAPSGRWLSVSGFGYSATRGTPAELSTTNPRFWRYPALQRTVGIVSGGTANVQASIGYDAGITELNGYTDRTYSTVQDRERDEDRNVTGRVFATQRLGKRGDVSAAVTFADVRRDETLTPGASSRYAQRLWSGALESGWQLARLRLSGGFAYDAAETPASGDKPAIERMNEWGARFGVTSAPWRENVILHAGIARRARFPSLREMYAGPLRMFEPNPDLASEVLIASEAGATAQRGSARLQLVGFHHIIDNEIVRTVTPAPARKVKRINRDERTSIGVELLGHVRAGPASLSADVTAQTVESKDPTSNREFITEYQPKWAGSARISTPVVVGINAHVTSRIVGAQYCLNQAGVYNRLDRTARTDVELSRHWGGIDVAMGVLNAGDAAIYDQCGLPQPGRVLQIRITGRAEKMR